MFINTLPDLDVLNELFTLNVESGDLFWKTSNNGVKVGDKAGVLKPAGYVAVMINGKTYMAHRIVYKMYHGVEPAELIDHADGNASNNNPKNIRDASHAQNAQNRNKKTESTSGNRNVFWRGDRKKWRVYISAFGKAHYFGLFDKKEDAIEVAEKQRKILHAEFANG